jgi:hypothetical protein
VCGSFQKHFKELYGCWEKGVATYSQYFEGSCI